MDSGNDYLTLAWSADQDTLLIDFSLVYGDGTDTWLTVDRRSLRVRHLPSSPSGLDWRFLGDQIVSYDGGNLVKLGSDRAHTTKIPLHLASPAVVAQGDTQVAGDEGGPVLWRLTPDGLVTITSDDRAHYCAVPPFVTQPLTNTSNSPYISASVSPDGASLVLSEEMIGSAAKLYLENTATGSLQPLALPAGPAGQWTNAQPYYEPDGSLFVTFGARGDPSAQYRFAGDRFIATGRAVDWSSADGRAVFTITDTAQSIVVDGRTVVTQPLSDNALLNFAIAGFS
jgi:hypothetical protein